MGAIGFEGASGYYLSLFKEGNLTYMMITMIEETFELVGIVVFIYALLGYLTLIYPQTQIYFNFLERNKTTF